ncbi:T9SS type A sorting domain-containing protein [Gracilimonas sp.]|uniref:T9SS type A sorting domain-containing protein n=1 Tax=Gracilimonas sp. TaxID=1974203 RepID=UPI003BAB8BB4
MKKYLLILSLSLFGSSLSFGQTTIQEQYFHELKGMEDSSGTTHLFYRLRVNKVNRYECNDKVETYYVKTNNVYHYSSNFIDTTRFLSYMGDSCTGNDTRSIINYQFYDNNPDKWITSVTYGYVIGINDHIGNVFDFNYPIAVKGIGESKVGQLIPDEFLLSPNGDSLYVKIGSHSNIPLSGNGEEWPVFENYDEALEFTDSLEIKWDILEIHPKIDSLYFAKNSGGDLFRSEHYSSAFTLSDSNYYFGNIYFDADTSHIYSLTLKGLLRSDDLGKENTWTLTEIDFNTGSTKFLTVDESVSGNLFISDSTDILISNNYGDTFTSLTSVDSEITGLYKKPNSNLLYVLTRKELLEINTETKSVTSLKQIPVSNEVSQNKIPKHVSLNQNYPNPFNPSTMIRYQLAENSLVRLEVFDVTGRKVAVLVNGERKAAGTHQVTFDAGNLASGIYFYRLETAGQTLTQKMLLVK